MAELPELNSDQILFLQTIFNVFHVKGKWPTYEDVDRIITQKYPNFNMEAVSKSMPDGFAAGFGFQRQYDQEAFFIVPALHYCQGAEQEIADFIRVVRLCVERHDRYYSFGEETPEKDALEFSSELLSSQLHMEPLAIRKMGLLLCHEQDIAFGFSSGDIEYNSWHFPLKKGTDGVRRFRGVETFDQYIEKRSPLVPPYYTGRYPLGLAQDKPGSDMTVMGLRRVSTQVPVHGDQYMRLSGNRVSVWDKLIAEIGSLNETASKIQVYGDKLDDIRQGLTDDEINQFVILYLAWYGECLSLLPDALVPPFRAEYEKKIKTFLMNPLHTDEGYVPMFDDRGLYFMCPSYQWFYIPSFAQKQILFEASKRQEKMYSLPDAASKIELLAQRFGLIARSLAQRGRNRTPLTIEDEYDVQYLFKGLLKLFFDDIRPEEWTPSYAGKSTRMDFLIKSEQIVIELKMTRAGLKTAKQVGEELIIDIYHYRYHADCKTLVAFVYDPERYVEEPRSLENDLSKMMDGMPVKVIVAQG